MADQPPTIIIKRKRKGGDDGHHGGQWKVAYADFMTAMMALFLIMWLLNAVTEEQMSGIANQHGSSMNQASIPFIAFQPGVAIKHRNRVPHWRRDRQTGKRGFLQ